MHAAVALSLAFRRGLVHVAGVLAWPRGPGRRDREHARRGRPGGDVVSRRPPPARRSPRPPLGRVPSLHGDRREHQREDGEEGRGQGERRDGAAEEGARTRRAAGDGAARWRAPLRRPGRRSVVPGVRRAGAPPPPRGRGLELERVAHRPFCFLWPFSFCFCEVQSAKWQLTVIFRVGGDDPFVPVN